MFNTFAVLFNLSNLALVTEFTYITHTKSLINSLTTVLYICVLNNPKRPLFRKRNLTYNPSLFLCTVTKHRLIEIFVSISILLYTRPSIQPPLSPSVTPDPTLYTN